MMKPSQILERAADVVERNGLHHGDWILTVPDMPEVDCPVCAGGAINVAALGHAEIDADDEASLRGAHRQAYLALARLIVPGVAEETEALIETVARWNDAERPTAEQVVAMLRAAAENERRQDR
ncbi:DUF6197 family protein [Actinomadura sediminis]|uniref:Uncharacterized protein n=1 Tax=Actinomadura sediminis TaxID=1038904 RepID=A0ABW3EUI2_9ACTN